MIKLATLDNLDEIMILIQAAKKHISSFNIDQWQNDYPSVEVIKNDINNKAAYLYCEDAEILAYFALYSYEKTYDYIKGKWLDDSDYVVIHRVATKTFSKGIGSALFMELKKKYHHIRIDTHSGNISMNKCLIKNDFKLCGTIYLANLESRLAYEWVDN